MQNVQNFYFVLIRLLHLFNVQLSYCVIILKVFYVALLGGLCVVQPDYGLHELNGLIK